MQLPPGPRPNRVAMSPNTVPRGRAGALPRVQPRAGQDDRRATSVRAGGHRRRVLVRVDPVLPLPAGSRAQLEGLAVPHRAAGGLASERRAPSANCGSSRTTSRTSAGPTSEPADPRDRLEERLEFVAAMEELSRLPPNAGSRWSSSTPRSGSRSTSPRSWASAPRASTTCCGASACGWRSWPSSARARAAVASPRAARLRELEDDPPKWLIEAIGRAPTSTRARHGGPGVAAGSARDRRLPPRRMAGTPRRSGSARPRSSRTPGSRTSARGKRCAS